MVAAGTAVVAVSQKAEWTADVGVGSKEEMAEGKTFRGFESPRGLAFPPINRATTEVKLRQCRLACSQSVSPRDGGNQETMVLPHYLSWVNGAVLLGHHGFRTNEEHREPRHGEFPAARGSSGGVLTLWIDPILYVGLQTP